MITVYDVGYNHMSGGMRALYALHDELAMRGVDVALSASQTGGTVIYPEVVKGNPLGADRPITWLLNRAEPTGEAWAWDESLGDYPLLTVNIIESGLWVPGPKSGRVAYWIGKGQIDYSVIPHDAIHIGRHNFPVRADLAAFVASLDYLISFDPFTAMNLEAVLAGTPVVLYPSAMQWNPANMAYESTVHEVLPRYGIARGMDELPLAIEQLPLARVEHEANMAVYAKRIDTFVDSVLP